MQIRFLHHIYIYIYKLICVKKLSALLCLISWNNWQYFLMDSIQASFSILNKRRHVLTKLLLFSFMLANTIKIRNAPTKLISIVSTSIQSKKILRRAGLVEGITNEQSQCFNGQTFLSGSVGYIFIFSVSYSLCFSSGRFESLHGPHRTVYDYVHRWVRIALAQCTDRCT